MSNDPSKPSAAVTAMQEDWAVVDPLMGGTKAMRAAGEALLPKWPKEEQDAYACRLKLSTLLPAYSETMHNSTGRVFAEPIAIGDNVPEQIAAYAQDIDQQGNNLQVWAQTWFSIGLSHGLCHVLVDYPKSDGARTEADVQALGLRPYAVLIKPEQIVGWKSTTRNGAHFLTQFRYAEDIEEENGLFGGETVKQIRVLEPGSWAVYRQTKSADGTTGWAVHDSGVTTLDHIPLATFYTKRTGFMTACPPLLELAHLNIKHWQSQSDQDNILHMARVPLLVTTGLDETQSITVGATATSLPIGGDMKWVEHSGKAIEAGRTSLQDLVDDMRLAGAKLLHKEKQVTKTATQAQSEEAQEMSPLQTMAGQFEDALDQVLQMFAKWMNLPEGGNVKVEGNFDVDYDQATTLPLLLNMAAQGRLSDQTLFSEIKRRGVVSDDLEWEDEKQRIADQGPALGGL